jgi:RNA exonuclease 1
MGTALSGESEIIRITMVDFFNQEILLDSLVQPSIPMKHYNTRFSGVYSVRYEGHGQKPDLHFRSRHGPAAGVAVCRARQLSLLFHDGHNDLSALRLIHPLIIDTFILESYGEAVVGGRSLKNLCLRRLGRVIQNGKGHCSREDALACRELVHWLAKQIPA